MKNYSQNSEQEHILKYFGDKTGTFLDVGSNDGVTLSNTHALALLGWNGVFVEPSPKAFARLKENYKGIATDNQNFYFYPFALGITNDKVKMWDSGKHLGNDDGGLLSTLVESDYNKWKPSTEFTEIEVQCFRWKTFLNRLTLKTFDFISCDAEGMDYEILKQIDLRDTSCVCVEYNGDGNLKEQFNKLMIGFKLIHSNGENLIYGR